MNFSLLLKKDSVFYSRRRKESSRKFLASVFSIIIALIVALLIATALGYQPWDIFTKLFFIGFNDPSYLFYKLGTYALAGFAFYFAWKCGIINIGISGQMLAAGTVVVILTQLISKNNSIPNWVGFGLGQIFILVIAMSVSSLIAFLVGAMQNYLRINGVVSAILLNWIIYFVSFFVLATYFTDSQPFANSTTIPNEFRLYDVNNGTGAIIPVVVICLVIALVLFFIFKFTVFGHKVKSIGYSKEASKFAGYNIKKLSIVSFVISGAISGILACICYSSTIPAAIPLSINFDNLPGEGFAGIMISLVGGNNPFGILAVSFLFGLFEASTIALPTDPSFNDVIIGLVMLGSTLSVIIIKWRPFIKLNSYKYDIEYFETQTNFDNSIDSLLSKYKSIYHNAKSSYVKKSYQKMLKDLKNIYEKKQENNKMFLSESINVLEKNFEIKTNLLMKLKNENIYSLKEQWTRREISNVIYDEKLKSILHKFDSEINQLNNQLAIEKMSIINEFKTMVSQNKEDYKELVKIYKIRYQENRFQEKLDFKQQQKKIINQYLEDKARIIDTFNFNKIKNLISKKIVTQELIDIKKQKISNKYDTSLTKYLNRLKQKHKGNNNLQKISQKAIEKSNQWKFNQINKMILKQNKIIDNDQKFNDEVVKIKKIIDEKIKSKDYFNELNELINNAIQVKGSN